MRQIDRHIVGFGSRCIALSVTLLACHQAAPSAPASIALSALSSPEARSSMTFGDIVSVHALADSGVLVNDAGQRRLVILDSALSRPTTLLDTSHTAPSRYPEGGGVVRRYRGDTLIFPEDSSRFLRLITPGGAWGQQFRLSKPGEPAMQIFQFRGFDANGFPVTSNVTNVFHPTAPLPMMGGDVSIVRVNSVAHTYDDVTRIPAPLSETMSPVRDDNGAIRIRRVINPLLIADDWAVLSDGTVAVVRGKEFRVELYGANGQKRTSPRLPFTKTVLSESDRPAYCETERAAREREAAAAPTGVGATGAAAAVNAANALVATLAGMGKDSVQRLARTLGSFTVNTSATTAPAVTVSCAPVSAMLDYIPPFRSGTMLADADANVWVPAAGTARDTDVERVYEVVSSAGVHAQRVRIPANREIVGFGRGGVVFLRAKVAAGGWTVERTRIQTLTRD